MARTNPLTIFLLCLHLVLGQNYSTNIESTPTILNTTTEPTPVTYEYVIRLIFGLENEKVSTFLLDTIFNNSNNITTTDIISLYSLDYLTLSSTNDILKELHYKPSKALSIDGLEKYLSDFGIDFKDLYKAVFITHLKLTGFPLRNFFIDLGVNIEDFANAIYFGEPDPFEVFKKGNFSEKNLDTALEKLSKTKDDLFEACKIEILNNVRSKSTEEFLNILKTHNFDRVEAMNLWKYLELDLESVERVTVFADLLDQIKFNLENTSYLGILSANKVAINKEIYKNIKEKMELSKIFAQSIYDNTTVELKEEKPYYENIVTLSLETDNFTTFIQVATTNKDLEHCQIITLENDTLISQYVEKVTNKNDTLEVSREDFNITSLIPGSPLICDNKVYGLAKEINNDEIVFDAFIVDSGAINIVFSPFLFVCLFVILLFIYNCDIL
ncbi:unnamed protein product [Psylliodes chrysocephalus]|uniref:Uncharacterized protein n=1 Tax=Psylliodes chrysocephalus TaxID=3402493 RepID=A0A9P0CI15_9CUCU|nr:unnamed protein product [Psylliodes chrysocephala]